MDVGRLAPPPRVVDWGVFAAVALVTATGLLSLVSGRPGDAWVFVAHGVVGVMLLVLLGWKFRRVWRRLGRVDGETAVSALLGVVALGAIATGVYWVHADLVSVLGFWTLMNVHVGLGLLLVPLLVWHLSHRYRPPARHDASRRTAMQFGLSLVAGAVLWRAQRAVGAALDLAGASRRFTGSKVVDDEGNAFPVTSWVADDPDPVDAETYRLRVDGRVDAPTSLAVADLSQDASTRAVLDCTSGWYTTREWGGRRVGDLLDAVEPHDDARYVRFVSVTGYRWSLPIEEARDAVLATHVDGRRLSHGHGFPCRLVAPGRRGFQWVKWVEAVEVRRHPDPGQWLATLVSGFD